MTDERAAQPDAARGAASADMLAALRLLATVERQSARLRDLEASAGHPRIDGAWAVRPGWRKHHTAASGTADPEGSDDRLPEIRADAAFLGRPSSELLRIRGFYAAAELTVAVHGREPLARSSRLLAGAAVLDRVHGRGPIVVPGVVERGRRLRHSWVVEELLPGRRFSTAEWASAVPELAAALTWVWLSGPVRTVPMGQVLSPEVVRSVGPLLEGGEDLPSPRPDLHRRICALADGRWRLLAGWCHGDPVHGNWLRLPDGRAALIDWELARRRPLGHDAMKILVGSADPLGVVEAVAPRLEQAGGRGTAPWRIQVAATLAAWLAAWPDDRAIAERTGRVPAYRRRLADRLALLDALTA